MGIKISREYKEAIEKSGFMRLAEDAPRVQCEECDLWVPRADICYLAGIQKELCAGCASDHGSEDWK